MNQPIHIELAAPETQVTQVQPKPLNQFTLKHLNTTNPFMLPVKKKRKKGKT